MKRLMILGAGYTQIPLYEAARALGVQTAAVSIPGDYPGFDKADVKYYTDISDPDAVVKAAKDFCPDGVATCGLDTGMVSIGAVSDALGIPGPSFAASKKAGNKYKMKIALSETGVQTAKFYRVHNEKELEAAMDALPFPVILKAVDLMGSRGIYRSDTREEARANFKKSMEATKQDYCLIEEFIEGELFGVEAMIRNGRFIFILPNNTEVFNGAVPSPIGHSIPFRHLSEVGSQVILQTEKAVRALGLDNCPVNCDFIKKGGEVYVVELTGRSGATGLSEMVGLYYGVNYYEMIVRLALGENVSGYFSEPKTARSILTHTLFSSRSGVVSRIVNKNRNRDWIHELTFNISPGDSVMRYTNGRDRIGQVIISGETLSRCERRLKNVSQNISLEFEGDIPVCKTPVYPLNSGESENRIFIKREDLLPFSFGGNKVRFAKALFDDMEEKQCDAMVIYGGYHSNLCRILSCACARKGIPCSMINNVDDVDPNEDSFNKRLIMSSQVKEYQCRKGNIAPAVQAALDDFKNAGYAPYYIYGNIYGEGNAPILMKTYADVYAEIISQEKNIGIHFDYIFLASSTNTTQSGLIAGMLKTADKREIIGISVSRNAERAKEVIKNNLTEYKNKFGVRFNSRIDSEIHVEDKYLAGGYGKFNDGIIETIKRVYEKEGIALDPAYTGKAFFGMESYLCEHKISGKNILFIHTGGTPLFFDIADKLQSRK